MTATIRPARPSDIRWIAADIRDIDRLECAVFHHTPRQSLHIGYAASVAKWTAEVGGRPAAMFGVTPKSAMDRLGQPWMLATNQALGQARAFLELGRPMLAEMLQHFPRLENRLHRDNAASKRWLRRLGFTIEPEVELVAGEPFQRFWLHAPQTRPLGERSAPGIAVCVNPPPSPRP